MILLWLLVLAASQVTEANFKTCPKETACIYHARCSRLNQNRDNVLATTNHGDFETWNMAHCREMSSSTGLYVRPLSNHIWNFTLFFTVQNIGIRFGDSLIIMANETEGILKLNPTSSTKFPLKEIGGTIMFTVKSPKKKLLSLCGHSDIIYSEEAMQGRSTKSKQPLFWQKVLELTPCDVSLIIDDCSNGTMNCTKLDINEKSTKCQGKEHMWLKSNQSTWKQLDTVKCDKMTKDWALANENGTLPLREGALEIRCAVEQPPKWEESATELQPHPQIKEELEKKKKEKEKEAKDSLLDSPFVWVGIALVGLIAIAAVLLAVGYAYRKWKNPTPTDKSGMSKTSKTVDYTQLSQDPSNQTSSSGKETEKDKKNVDEPSVNRPPVPTPPPSLSSQTPAPPQQAPVSRLDGHNADTINRLSILNTIEDSKIAPIPAPPSK